MSAGKMSAQASHAAVDSVLKSPKKKVEEWVKEGAKKVILGVKDKKELLEFKRKAGSAGLINSLITDAAKTFFKEPTTTCLGIGPDEEKKIDVVSGKLKIV